MRRPRGHGARLSADAAARGGLAAHTPVPRRHERPRRHTQLEPPRGRREALLRGEIPQHLPRQQQGDARRARAGRRRRSAPHILAHLLPRRRGLPPPPQARRRRHGDNHHPHGGTLARTILLSHDGRRRLLAELPPLDDENTAGRRPRAHSLRPRHAPRASRPKKYPASRRSTSTS